MVAAVNEKADTRRATGASGEELAAAWLTRRGWTVLARNWRCRSGELDIIARDPGGALVACEVKTRRGLGFGDPLESITHVKLRRLRDLVCEWRQAQEEAVGYVRLDAIGVLIDADGRPRLRHLRNLEQR
nr:YraN family protein [Propionibacterium sp.]